MPFKYILVEVKYGTNFWKYWVVLENKLMYCEHHYKKYVS